MTNVFIVGYISVSEKVEVVRRSGDLRVKYWGYEMTKEFTMFTLSSRVP